MSDEYQLRKDIDRIYGDIYTLQGNELNVYKKDELDAKLSSTYYDKSEVDVKLNNVLLDIFYPIGTVYECTNAINPNTQFGGTWELLVDDEIKQWERIE